MSCRLQGVRLSLQCLHRQANSGRTVDACAGHVDDRCVADISVTHTSERSCSMESESHPFALDRRGNEPAIRFTSVVTTFGDELVLDRVSFEVGDGDFVCLLGPSGCGKSTTLRILGDLLDFDEGAVAVAGRPPRDSWRDLAYVFQQPRLLPWRTVLGNVIVGMDLRGVGGSRAERRATAIDKLALVGLADAAHKYPGVLSGGERQRVA